MTEINNKIIKMIDENKSLKEISILLGLSEKQVYVRIRQIINYGYQVISRYSYNADIYYKIWRKFYNPVSNQVTILTQKDKPFRCLVTSDIQIGNIDSDINLLKIVYEYASKEGINIILNCGDLLEGIYSSDKKSLKTLEQQLNFLLKKYPYDKNINNFIILGNHDYHSLFYDGIDIQKRIINSRYDIVPIGFGKGIIKLKDDNLLLEHELSVDKNPIVTQNSKISLVGHGHMMKTKIYDKLYICVPTLSYISPDKTKEVLPGFIDMQIHFNNNKFGYIELKHMVLTPKIYQASESRCKISEIFNESGNNYVKIKGK